MHPINSMWGRGAHLINFKNLQEAVHKKWSFPLKISSVNVTIPQFAADLVTFTEEIFNGKLHFLCSEDSGHLQKGSTSIELPVNQ